MIPFNQRCPVVITKLMYDLDINSLSEEKKYQSVYNFPKIPGMNEDEIELINLIENMIL